MVSNNPCAFAINVGSPILDCNKNNQDFLLMSCIIVGSTSQLFVLVCNRLNSITLVLG